MGNVVNCADDELGNSLALVVATAGGVADGLHLEMPDGPALEVLELPYSLETD